MSRLASLDMSLIEAARPRINWSVKPDDHMFAKYQLHYEEVGESALRCILASMLLANRPIPSSVLDFGSGSGRVLRWLTAAFPASSVDAVDVREDALEFCKETFGVNTWISSADIAVLHAPRKYDLIWSGSVFTHLDEGDFSALLDKFTEWLNPGGVAVVTTHGRRALSNLINKRIAYASPNQIDGILSDYRSTGYAFVPFKDNPKLGNSFNTLSWASQKFASLERRMVTFSEAAWDKHQDVISFQKSLPELDLYQ